ncbi:hypothetical protein NKI96_10580 [Mesorhizobium sp. M0292]|uniref:hypothetical protein n=1 Tax=Mesorhizobium sp. M0292 TaxID=2956929 RepID=UPI003338C144
MNVFGKSVVFDKSIFGKSIFGKIMAREIGESLGNPLGQGSGAFMARKAALALMRGGRGFRTPARKPRVYSNGMTRGQRKRLIRAACATAESDRQKLVCSKKADLSGIPFDQLKYQFGALAGR